MCISSPETVFVLFLSVRSVSMGRLRCFQPVPGLESSRARLLPRTTLESSLLIFRWDVSLSCVIKAPLKCARALFRAVCCRLSCQLQPMLQLTATAAQTIAAQTRSHVLKLPRMT